MNYKLFVFSQTKVLFISDKEYISQSTRKVKTQKTIMCSSWSKRNSSSTYLLFRKNFLLQSHAANLPFPCLAFQNFNWKNAWSAVTFFSRNRILQNTFSWLTYQPQNVNFRVDTKKLNHSWFQKNRTKPFIRLSQMFESEQIAIKCRCLFWIDSD